MRDIEEPPAKPVTRAGQRSRERRSAQHLIRVLVDFLAADPPPEGFRSIADVSSDVLIRSGALAAARNFLEVCSGEEPRP